MKYLLKNKKGMVLAVMMSFIAVLAVTFTSITAMSSFSTRRQGNTLQGNQALYLAEAAIERSKVSLAANFSATPVANDGTKYALGGGEYYFNVAATANPNQKLVTGYGAIPNFTNPKQKRAVQMAIDSVPTSIGLAFDNAIFSATTININGAANTVTGNIFAGNNISCSPSSCPGVSGTKTSAANPSYALPAIDMAAMKKIAQSQGNYFATAPSAASLPQSFYYTAPSGGNLGVPNVVYIESTLTLSGTQKVGGFVVVAGNYATNPSSPGGNVTVSGSSKIIGSVYCLGTYTSNGGGSSGTTVDGVIYAKNTVTLNGKPSVTGNTTYINSLKAAQFAAGDVDGSQWNEINA
jgi:hypothetical protein